MFIAIAILAFGILIAVHELGHFTAAKLLGVRVNEFAIGLGPKILKKQGKETLYSLRLLPFGGFCAMEGVDEESNDERSFSAQKRWKRVVILAAGGIMNFIAAFIIVVILVSGMSGFRGTTIVHIRDEFPNQGEHGLMVGDTLVSLNGERLYYLNDFEMFMHLAEERGNREVDLVIRRDGRIIRLNNFPLERREMEIDGQILRRFGLTFNSIEATMWQRLRFSGYTSMNFVRIIRVSITELIGGAFGVRDVHGAIGIIDEMNVAGQMAPTVRAGIRNIAHFTALMGVNLAVVNLLPIPALDGGRILFIGITYIIEKITRKRLDPKYEGYIHTAAFVLLLGFLAFTLVNDVVRIAGRG